MGSSCLGYVLSTSCPGYELSWVLVLLGMSCLGYELSRVRVVRMPSRDTEFVRRQYYKPSGISLFDELMWRWWRAQVDGKYWSRGLNYQLTFRAIFSAFVSKSTKTSCYCRMSFIFSICHGMSIVITPFKYGCKLKNLLYDWVTSNNIPMEPSLVYCTQLISRMVRFQILGINSLRPSDASVNNKWTIIGSANGLSLGQRQAIIWTNACIYLKKNIRNKRHWNFDRNSYIFIQENVFESVVWKMSVILFRPPQCVNEDP